VAAGNGKAPVATQPQQTIGLKRSTPIITGQLLTATMRVGKPVATRIPTATLADRNEKILLTPATAPQSLLVLDPIQIRSPGAGSNVISPIPIEVQFASGRAGNSIRIELYGKDGRLLARKLLASKGLALPGDTLTVQIEYEISAESENGWLVIGVDEAPGVPAAVNSTTLTLLSSGPAVFNPSTWQAKWIDIQEPVYGAHSSNGLLTVSGLTRQNAANPLKLRLISSGGRIISQAVAKIYDSPGAEFMDFTAQMVFNVKQPTQAWVVVYTDSNPAEVVTHLASLLVTLTP